MKTIVSKIISSLIILTFLTIAFSTITQAEETKTNNAISLRGTTDGKTIELNWDALNGSQITGYRIVWSLDENPTYPPGPNGYYDTIRKISTDTYVIDLFKNTGRYYTRICAFDAEENCLYHSNQKDFLIEEIEEIEVDNAIVDNTTTETEISEETEVVTPHTPAKISLTDIKDHQNQEAIEYLYIHRVISGYPDDTFRPDTTVNRAELLKILVGGQGVNPDTDQFKNCFPDVTDEWFAPYICYAKTSGWVSGYPDGTFGPGLEVNKAEAIKMMVNSQKYTLPESIINDVYFDVLTNDWFAPYVITAKEKNLLEEIGSLFKPEALMTRAGISENIYRAMYIKEKELEKFLVEKI